MSKVLSVLYAGALCACLASPTFAQQVAGRPGGGGGGGPPARSVPGPVAGVGLPILLAAGAYLWFQRRPRSGSLEE